ncbi:hypothetical protein [Photorhabdus akhurstii]|uniref:hypothetical protein n=1 Tax=Photorhabdus akhurstii TaxID=171438 RepID=UPI001BD47C5A|nr:hypothetical protein [Photorhabdus akhurstii]
MGCYHPGTGGCESAASPRDFLALIDTRREVCGRAATGCPYTGRYEFIDAPYVDYVGIAAADMLVSTLDQLLLPTLGAISHRASVC